MAIVKNLKEELKSIIKKDSEILMATNCFSIYAFKELIKELQNIKNLRFIFTSPAFLQKQESKEKREFYIPRLNRERSIYGTEFELKLKNELFQKASSKEYSDWIKEKVIFKSIISDEKILNCIIIDDFLYTNITEFTTDIFKEKALNLNPIFRIDDKETKEEFFKSFENSWENNSILEDVTKNVLDSLKSAYKENSPEYIYFITLNNVFNEFFKDNYEDNLPNEATGFKKSQIWNMLYRFQKDAVLGIINKLEKFNGCILADSVGLGKTFTALSVIKYYENRNKNVLVLCPKRLANNWNIYNRYSNKHNLIKEDKLRYDVLFHTDLGREKGYSNGIELESLVWENYDLIVIDESHNFRNGGKLYGEDKQKENRYLKLLNNVIRKGVKTKVLMLSATPVNNKFIDLKNQIALAYEGDCKNIDSKLKTSKSIDEIFKKSQLVFNNWNTLNPLEKTTDKLISMLDFDFFEVLDSVTIARSRKHIKKYYNYKDVGNFPQRLKPISLSPKLSTLDDNINYDEIFSILFDLELAIYTTTKFIHESKTKKYAVLYGDDKYNEGFNQFNRERGLRQLMAINLLKRLESSIDAFKKTLLKLKESTNNAIDLINRYENNIENINYNIEFDLEDFDEEEFAFGDKVKIELKDMDYISWKKELLKDKERFEQIENLIKDITPNYDGKLKQLHKTITEKINNPINNDNKKIIIFTASDDTAKYIYKCINKPLLEKYNINTAIVTGSVETTNIPQIRKDLNTILTYFSPVSKNKKLLYDDDLEIDILIATDCISEGQNLQDCDYLINYDIHWNPVRIIQRFGRIDRIGSKNDVIQLVNFWPDVSLDKYIALEEKVKTKMKIVDMTATGNDNILELDENKGDLEYRKIQLEKLKNEVVDIEEVSSSISIMDLGLNDFRIDLLEYSKFNEEIDKIPYGLHSVVDGKGNPSGVIYVLKNKNENINIDNKNRLHPFYLVYVKENGEIYCNHLQTNKLLETMRYLCKGEDKPIVDLVEKFDKETKGGKDMKIFSELLQKAISSIINVKETSNIDSFLSGEDINFKSNEIKGLDDFELISFLVIKNR